MPARAKLELTKRDNVRELLEEAGEQHGLCTAARSCVTNAQQVALFHAWQCGIRLNKLRKQIQPGLWREWLELNFCQRFDIGLSTAYLYMKIDTANVELREEVQRVRRLDADNEIVKRLKFDTVRKYAIGFVPEKAKSELKGDFRFARSKDHMRTVNEFAKYRRRRDEDLLGYTPKAADEQRDFLPLYLWLRDILRMEAFALEHPPT